MDKYFQRFPEITLEPKRISKNVFKADKYGFQVNNKSIKFIAFPYVSC